MKRITTASLLSLAVLAGTGAAQAATTLSFQDGVNGYAGTRDTMVRSNETATGAGQAAAGDSRNLSFGGVDFISVDGDDGSPGSKPNHGLLRFEGIFGSGPGLIRADDVILGASLTLRLLDPGSGMTVHSMLADWSETSTWNSLVNGVSANGVEAVAAPLATYGANNSSANVPTGTLVIDVLPSLLWAQAGNPFTGWAFLPFSSGTNGIDFATSEYADAALRPLLTVSVQPVPLPASALLLAPAFGLLGLRRRVAA
jgi:hypothetical protein